jgi:two-component system sensor histidine kinase KdpD
VDAQMESYRRAAGIAEPWAVRERVLVCIGDADRGLRLVRAARRLVVALKADWIVAHVETPGQVRETGRQRDALVDVLGLAEELGAETAMLSGLRVADEILHFARERHVSRIVLGRPRSPLAAWLPGALVQRLLRAGGDLDVHVIAGGEEDAPRPQATAAPHGTSWRAYAGTLTVVGACTALAMVMSGAFDLSNLVMVYLLGVTVAGVSFGRGPAILAAVLGVALFDFCFVPPRFQFGVADTQYVVTFGVMLVVAVVIGTLAARTREQAHAARARERRTTALFQLSQELAVASTVPRLVASAVARIRDVSGARVALLLPGERGALAAAGGDSELFASEDHELGVAQWAYDHAEPAGVGTDTLPASRALHLPLVASGVALGVLSLQPGEAAPLTDPDRLRLVQTFANQTAVALERAQLSGRAEAARVDAEAERARNALLSSVSHDLRTPLAVITGAATGLRDAGDAMPAETRHELADTIAEEATRLNRLVGELLDMTRLESGAMALRREWHSLAEVVGGVLERLERTEPGRHVALRADADLPLALVDEVLVGQAVHNLVENALQLSAAPLPVEVVVACDGDALTIDVLDRGPGLAPGEETRVFEKFYRGGGRTDRHGAGLGLTIARGLAEAHGGTLTAHTRPGGGADFRLRLPVGGVPPAIDPEPAEETVP